MFKFLELSETKIFLSCMLEPCAQNLKEQFGFKTRIRGMRYTIINHMVSYTIRRYALYYHKPYGKAKDIALNFIGGQMYKRTNAGEGGFLNLCFCRFLCATCLFEVFGTIAAGCNDNWS